MVILQNQKRVFDKPTLESSTSTTNNRVVSLYGVTNYNDIVDCIIPIKAISNGGSGVCTINVNNLGAKSLKAIINGIESDLPANWILSNRIYYVVYNNNKFTLFSGNLGSSGGSNSSYIIDVGILNLTSSSTAADILDVTGDTTSFVNNVTDANKNSYVFDDTYGKVIKILDSFSSGSTLTLEFIYNSYLYKYVFTITSGDFSSVVVTSDQMIYPNGNNMQF